MKIDPRDYTEDHDTREKIPVKPALVKDTRRPIQRGNVRTVSQTMMQEPR
jgi:hypothetical protein